MRCTFFKSARTGVAMAISLKSVCACSLTDPLDVERQLDPEPNLPDISVEQTGTPSTSVESTSSLGEELEDGVILVASPSPEPLPGTNLVENSDLEQSQSGWSAAYGGVLSVTEEDAHSGDRSIVVSARTEIYQGAHFDLTDLVQAGAEYEVRVFAKLQGARVDSIGLTAFVQCEEEDGRFLTIANTTGSDEIWTELRGQFAMPGAEGCFAEMVKVYVEGPAPGVDLFVDDLEMVLTTAGEPSVVNLVSNPGFEDGVEGWSAAFGGTLVPSSAQAHTGGQSALVTDREFEYQGPHFDLTSQAAGNASYLIRAFARPSTGSDVSLNLTSQIQCEGQEEQFVTIAASRGSDSQWTQLEGVLNLPGELSCNMLGVRVYVEGPGAGVDLYVDDVFIERGEDTLRAVNLIGNSGFESGVDGWIAAFGGTLAGTDIIAHSGSQSAMVSRRTRDDQGLHIDVTSSVAVGARYAFAAFAWLGGATTDNIKVTLRQRCDGLADEFVQLTSVEGSNSQWTLLSGEVSIPQPLECENGEFLLYVEGPQAGVDLIVDDVSLIEIE